MALEQINNGDSGAMAAAKILNNDKKTAALAWTAADAGAVHPTVRVVNGVMYQVIDGQTATTTPPNEDAVNWQTLGGKVAQTFDKTNDTEAVTAADVSEYIGDFPETKRGEEELIDLTTAAWVNGKYVTAQGIINDHPNARYMAIPISAGDSIVTNLAIVNGVPTNVFASESGQYVAGYQEASNNVYAFADFFNKNGVYYINQNLDATQVNYIKRYHVPTEEVDLVGFIEDKFKVVKNGSPVTLDMAVGVKGVFYDLNAAIIGVSKYGVPAYVAADYDTSRFYKVKAGERYYLTAWVGWNGAALFDDNRVLTHKLLYSPVQGTQVTEAEIIIPADGYMNIGFDRTKPHALKKLSSTVETVTVQELYNGVGGTTASMTSKTYINLPKPNNLWILNVVGNMPTADGEKNMIECTFNSGGADFLKCKIEVSLQGQSSLTNPKKNYTFDLMNGDEDALALKIGGFISSDSWHLKGFQKDVSMLRDNLTGSLWHQIRKSAAFPSNTLTTLPLNVSPTASDPNYFEEDARFFADGFPVEMHVNNVFNGLYIFRLKKSRQNYKINNALKSNIMLEFDYMLDIANGVRLLDWKTFDYKQYELKSPKLSGYTAGGPINDGTVMASINGLWAWTSAIYNNTATDESKVDLTAWIDYLIACEVADHWDGFSQNIIIISHDGVKFMPYVYDCDHDWGIRNDGTEVRTTKTQFMLNQNFRPGEDKTFWVNFRTKYATQIRARYTELRKLGIISVQNIDRLAVEFIKPYGYDNFKREFAKWGYGVTPVVGKASLRQILQTANASITYLDNQWLNP